MEKVRGVAGLTKQHDSWVGEQPPNWAATEAETKNDRCSGGHEETVVEDGGRKMTLLGDDGNGNRKAGKIEEGATTGWQQRCRALLKREIELTENDAREELGEADKGIEFDDLSPRSLEGACVAEEPRRFQSARV